MKPVLPVYDMEGKEVDRFSLDKDLFDGSVNEALLYQAVNSYRANQRQGSASTKTRSEVSGGGKKPWKQKGTGRARVSSIRSPLWRHGGVVFGPHPRDFRYDLPKKIKTGALLSSLNGKLRDGEVMLLSAVVLGGPKSKVLAATLKKLDIKGATLLVADKIDNNLKLASRNIDRLKILRSSDLNTYEVLTHRNIIFTKKAIEDVTSVLKAVSSKE